MAHGSKKAVITAIVGNSIVTVLKFFAGIVSGSAAMMNEAIHSLMDTANQMFLFIGLKVAEKPADETYAFGHGQKKYLWNLWSAIGLFSIGAGLGLSHAWHSWKDIEHIEEAASFSLLGFQVAPVAINLVVLAIAFIIEGYSFLVAFRTFLKARDAAGYTSSFAYLGESEDPTLIAVVLEDSVAMFGLLLAAVGIGLTALTGNHIYDIFFSALIAVTLGLIAFYLGYVNMGYLADMRDSVAEEVFVDVIKNHPEVERYHDLRSIIIDEAHTILVAEIELCEEALVPKLQQEFDQERDRILELIPSHRRSENRCRSYASARASVEITIKRTETIIDEIEAEIRARLPRVDHITLEVEGISEEMHPPENGN
jgi:zinc transporter 9